MKHPEAVLTDCGPCGKVLRIDADWFGQSVNCPHCYASFVVTTFRGDASSTDEAKISHGSLSSGGSSNSENKESSTTKAGIISDEEMPTKVRLGRYELTRVLGQGAFGKVFLAVDPELDRQVAIKLPTLSGTHQAAERFRKEARAVAKLRHPNIVAVFDHGQTKKHVYIVYEYVPGRTCQEVLVRQQVASDSTAAKVGSDWQREWIERVATLGDALSYAADQNLVHRDIKPANIMIDTRGRPQIMDFGLAKAMTRGVAATDGGIAGTPAYMSPEQARGESKIGPGSDQYSLAAVLYEALTGEKTVRLSGKAAIIEVSQRESVPTEPLTNLNSDLRTIIVKAMSTSPEDRYPDCSAFASDLRHYLRLEPIEGVRPSLGRKARLWTQRNRSTAWASIAVVALLVTVATISTVFNLQLTTQRKQLRDALSLADVARQRAEAGQAEAQKQTQRAERQTEFARLSEEKATLARLEAETALAKVKEAQSKTELARQETETALAEKLAASEKTRMVQSELKTVASQNQKLRYAENLVMAYGALRRGQVSDSQLTLNDCPESLRGWEWQWLRSLSQYPQQLATRLTQIPSVLTESLTPLAQMPSHQVNKESKATIDFPDPSEMHLIVQAGQPISMAVEIRKQERIAQTQQRTTQPKTVTIYQAFLWNLQAKTSKPLGLPWAQRPSCGVIHNTNLVSISGKRAETDANGVATRDRKFEVWECTSTPVIRIEGDLSTNWWSPSFATIGQRNILLGCTTEKTMTTWDMKNFVARVRTKLDFQVHHGPNAMRTNPDQTVTMLDANRRIHLVSPTRAVFQRIGRHETPSQTEVDSRKTATLTWSRDGRYLAINEYASSLGSISQKTASETLFLPEGIEIGNPQKPTESQIAEMKASCFSVIDVSNGLQVALVPQPATQIVSLRKRNEDATKLMAVPKALKKPIQYKNESRIMCRRLLPIAAVTFNPGERLLGIRDRAGGIWAYETRAEIGKRVYQLPIKSNIEQMVSSAGTIVVANENRITVLRIEDSRGYRTKVLKRVHTKPIKHLAINTLATRLLALDETGVVTYWDLETDRLVTRLTVPQANQAVFMDKRGQRAAITDDSGRLILKDLAKSTSIATVKAHAGKVTALAVSHQQHAVFSAGEDRILRYIDSETGQGLDQEVIYTREILTHLAPDESNFTLLGFGSQSITRFEYGPNQIRKTQSVDSPTGVREAIPMPSQPRWVATDGRTIHLFDSETSRLVFSLPPQEKEIVHIRSQSSRELSFVTHDGKLHWYAVDLQPNDE